MKRLYRLTNKRDAPEQIGCHYRQGRHFDRPESQGSRADSVQELHHSIANSRNHPVQLASFSSGNTRNPAAKVDVHPFLTWKPSPDLQNFIYKLRIHLLSRLLNKGLNSDDPSLFTDKERNSVRIINNTIYSTKEVILNYTTYDIRQDSDIINTSTHPYVVLRSPEVGARTHPYWYAQVLGVFHAHISVKDS